jgi:hypothetical protein
MGVVVTPGGHALPVGQGVPPTENENESDDKSPHSKKTHSLGA